MTHGTWVAAVLVACLAGSVSCERGRESEHGDGHGHAEAEHGAEEGGERGPRGGRWFELGEHALELTIYETGVAPQFRAFVYRNGELVDPAGVELEVTLRRLGGRVERIGFAARGDHLLGDREVAEPHSFDVEIRARLDGREQRFDYASRENRVTLSAEQRSAAGVEIAIAGPARIWERLVLNGRISADEDTLAHVMPRFPGVVRSVHKRLGDRVARGDLLAVIESNESLHPYEIRARSAGTVIAKSVAPGEFAGAERELFAIADLGTVWVDLDAYRRDFARLRVGQRVRIEAGDGSAPAEAALSYLAPVGSVHTQTLLARAVLPNPDGSWRPGLFVTGEVEVAASEVPVAVGTAALQRLRDRDVVFIAEGDVLEAQPVVVGRHDAERVEIVSGLAPGQAYVAAGSFIVKAEAGKSGAGHDH
jgi:cobalt-zinc-cadmium efflux system membrane fusion protein